MISGVVNSKSPRPLGTRPKEQLDYALLSTQVANTHLNLYTSIAMHTSTNRPDKKSKKQTFDKWPKYMKGKPKPEGGPRLGSHQFVHGEK